MWSDDHKKETYVLYTVHGILKAANTLQQPVLFCTKFMPSLSQQKVQEMEW